MPLSSDGLCRYHLTVLMPLPFDGFDTVSIWRLWCRCQLRLWCHCYFTADLVVSWLPRLPWQLTSFDAVFIGLLMPFLLYGLCRFQWTAYYFVSVRMIPLSFDLFDAVVISRPWCPCQLTDFISSAFDVFHAAVIWRLVMPLSVSGCDSVGIWSLRRRFYLTALILSRE